MKIGTLIALCGRTVRKAWNFDNVPRGWSIEVALGYIFVMQLLLGYLEYGKGNFNIALKM